MDSAGKTGLWTAIPYASMWASSILFSLASDFLIRRKILSTAIVRKVLIHFVFSQLVGPIDLIPFALGQASLDTSLEYPQHKIPTTF